RRTYEYQYRYGDRRARTFKMRSGAQRALLPVVVFVRDHASQNVPRQVFVLDDLREHLRDVTVVDGDLLVDEIRPLEGNLIEQLLHDRVQPPRPDVLGPLVDQRRVIRDPIDGVLGELKRDALGLHQSGVLLDQRAAGLG